MKCATFGLGSGASQFHTVFKWFPNGFVHRFQTVSEQGVAIFGMVRSGLKRCRNRFPNRLKFGAGSRNVTWSESGNRNGLMSGSDTRCAVCHFLTCRFWHVPVLACQFWIPTGFYTVLKRFHASLGTPPGFYTVFKPFDASL